jgi:hypothetical protein
LRRPPLALLLLLVLLVLGCTSRHDAALREVRSGECVTCHLADYNGATSPVHLGQMPTTCRDCHVTAAWLPALGGGHPEGSFPIGSGPHQLDCLSCHDVARGTSVGGQNTSCIGCHAGTHTQGTVDSQHTGVAGYQFDAAMPHFCLSCHPSGQAAKHPESKFPIDRGAHSEITCVDCHDPTLSGDAKTNVSCTGCHTGEHARARMDSRHREARDYVWSDSDKQFCRRCHPTGRGD